MMTVFRNDDLCDRSNVLFVDGEILRYDKRSARRTCATSTTASASSRPGAG